MKTEKKQKKIYSHVVDSVCDSAQERCGKSVVWFEWSVILAIFSIVLLVSTFIYSKIRVGINKDSGLSNSSVIEFNASEYESVRYISQFPKDFDWNSAILGLNDSITVQQMRNMMNIAIIYQADVFRESCAGIIEQKYSDKAWVGVYNLYLNSLYNAANKYFSKKAYDRAKYYAGLYRVKVRKKEGQTIDDATEKKLKEADVIVAYAKDCFPHNRDKKGWRSCYDALLERKDNAIEECKSVYGGNVSQKQYDDYLVEYDKIVMNCPGRGEVVCTALEDFKNKIKNKLLLFDSINYQCLKNFSEYIRDNGSLNNPRVEQVRCSIVLMLRELVKTDLNKIDGRLVNNQFYQIVRDIMINGLQDKYTLSKEAAEKISNVLFSLSKYGFETNVQEMLPIYCDEPENKDIALKFIKIFCISKTCKNYQNKYVLSSFTSDLEWK